MCDQSPASASWGGVRLQAGVLGAGRRLSGYNYLVSSANYTSSITTALYHAPTTYTFLHIPPHLPPVQLPGVQKNARERVRDRIKSGDHTPHSTPPLYDKSKQRTIRLILAKFCSQDYIFSVSSQLKMSSVTKNCLEHTKMQINFPSYHKLKIFLVPLFF